MLLDFLLLLDLETGKDIIGGQMCILQVRAFVNKFDNADLPMGEA